MPHILTLPTRLDVDAACALWIEVSRSDGDIHFDASTLTYLGAAGLQVLLMAQRRPAGQENRTVLINAGSACLSNLAQMGASDHIVAQPSIGPGGAA